ncbi:hypothetical protein [Planktothricoides raciborskii]|uniref:Uncharacterized protein n=1 Tax=Planktothricoides raciborskii GIHE-MW2 TaxID=2792601 RepID=A0AAU8JEW7_9CYAN
MANPIFACRIPDDDLQAFREICKRYNLDPGEVVKRFISDSVREGVLPDRILDTSSESLTLHERVARLEARIDALETEKKQFPPLAA